MNIYIGENIKRLRQQRGITQEKFAEYVKVSAPAVSKWERGETLPDITLILPIANFFDVSTDELLGYDKTRVELEIKRREDELSALAQTGFSDYHTAVKAAYRDYPNNYTFMIRYMDCVLGGRAVEGSEAQILAHTEEFIPLCQRILDECTDDILRRDALHTLASIYRVNGNIEAALDCFDNMPNWYDAKEHRTEQIFPRGSEEWRGQIYSNMSDLTDFAVTKIVRVIWWGMDKPIEEKVQLIDDLVEFVESFTAQSGFDWGSKVLGTIYHDSGNYCNRNEELHHLAAKYYGKMLENRTSQSSVDWCKSTPFLAKLREREDFQEILARYE